VALLIGNTSYKGNTEGHLEHFSGNVAVGLNVRDFGNHLDCAWFLTVQPGFFQRTAAKFAQNGNGLGLSVFDEQDLGAWIFVTHRAFMRAVKELMEELELDFTGMNTQSKG
jgi:hypothetical protein